MKTQFVNLRIQRISLMISALLYAGSVFADTASYSVNIPAQRLDTALQSLAQQSGTQILFVTDTVNNYQSENLNGQLTVEQALTELLKSKNLQIKKIGENKFSIVEGKPQARNMGQLNTIDVVTQNTSVEQANTLQLPTIVVTAENNNITENSGSYKANNSQAGSKISQSLKDTPRSVSVITRQQLDDQRMTNLNDVVTQLPGITLTPSTTGYAADSFYTRGFQISSITVDGSPSTAVNSNNTAQNTGMAKYDSVQLVRGPDGIFSGNGQPSGSINLVRKRPLDEYQLKGTLSAGSWNNYFGEIDISSPLISDGTVRGRFVAAHNDRQFFFDNADRDVSTLYGIIDTDISDNAVLSLGASYDRDYGQGREIAPHLPRYSTGETLPVPRKQGYTDWSFKNSESINVFTTLENTWADRWKSKLNLSYTDTSLASNISSYNGAVDPITGLGSYLFQGTWADDGKFKTFAADTYLTGTFDFLDREHQIIVGADYTDNSNYVMLYGGTAGRADIVDWANTDPDQLLPSNSRGNIDWLIASSIKQYGIYSNAKFELLENLHLILGGRYTAYQRKDDGGDATQKIIPKTTNDKNSFVPYYALTYAINPEWSTFFTLAESFEDQSNYFDESNHALEPTEGKSYEWGLKGEVLDQRLNTSLTLYYTKRNNFAVLTHRDTAFDIPGRSCCYSGDGKFISQGIELELNGNLTDVWQLNAGYTFDDNETSYGANKGSRLASYTPKHMFKLWTRYQLPNALNKFAIGGGVTTQSNFFKSGTVSSWNPTGGKDGTGAFDGPTVAYEFSQAGRSIWSAFAEYKINPEWTAALNVNNVFDKQYFAAVGNTASGNIYGTPREFLLTIRAKY